MGARFSYPLEPVVLQRRWALDALLRELSECNDVLAQRNVEREALLSQMAQTSREWKTLGSDGGSVHVERFMLLSRYMAERQRQLDHMTQVIAQLALERDQVVDKVAAGRRALDAIEDHRDEMRQLFIKSRLSDEFKNADEQWNGSQTIRAANVD